MKVLICTQPGSLEYAQAEPPVLRENHAVIKVKRVGICGTDLHAFEGTQPFFDYPRILGHELAGELAAFDNAPGFKIGEKVTFIPYFSCGECIACRSGKPNCCSRIQVFGVHIDGGMSEYITVPSCCLLHGDDLSYEELALVEPLAIGAHGVRRADVKKDEFVLVMGAGPIGLAAMESARIAGAKVTALDVNESRLAFCKEKLNVHAVVNALAPDVSGQIMEITGGDMAEVVIDATGNLKAINSGINYLAHGGRYVLIGLQKESFCFSHPEFHKRESTLMSSRNAVIEDFEQVISAVKNGLLDPQAYITHQVGFEKVKDDFKSWLNPENKVMKAMISME